MRALVIAAVIAAFCQIVSSAAPFPEDPPSRKAGFVLEALSSEDLDGIESETGYRVGVLVKAVTPGSPADRAGFRGGDVLFTVGDQGVDSPQAVDRSLLGKTDAVEIVAVRPGEDGEYEALQLTVQIPAGDRRKPPVEKKDAAAVEVEKIKAQLDALEKARGAGILSDEEYARKKKELEASLKALQEAPPPLDEAARQRLDALEKAREAGILDDEEYARKKKEILGDRAVPPAADGDAGAAGRNAGRTYNHAVGFTFWYPSAWTVKEIDESLQLVPSDPGTSPEGPTEFYFIGGESVAAEGIRTPDDPRVIEYLDQQIYSLAPALQRKSGQKSVNMARGQGLVLDWEGQSPSGDTVVARVFVSIIKDYGITLVALGLKEKVEQRDAELRRMFASFGFGEGKRDPKVAGRWRLAEVRSITNTSPWETDWSRAQLVSESDSFLSLMADGTWQRRDKEHMLAGAGGVWLESNEESVSKGKWYAAGGSLYLIWEDDSWQDYQYTVRGTDAGRELRLVSGSRGEVWKEVD